MPFKDLEKKREYQRKWRAEKLKNKEFRKKVLSQKKNWNDKNKEKRRQLRNVDRWGDSESIEIIREIEGAVGCRKN